MQWRKIFAVGCFARCKKSHWSWIPWKHRVSVSVWHSQKVNAKILWCFASWMVWSKFWSGNCILSWFFAWFSILQHVICRTVFDFGCGEGRFCLLLDFQSCSMSSDIVMVCCRWRGFHILLAGQCLILDAVKVDFAFCLILNLAACHLTLLWCAADEGDSTFSWRCLRLLGWIPLRDTVPYSEVAIAVFQDCKWTKPQQGCRGLQSVAADFCI